MERAQQDVLSKMGLGLAVGQGGTEDELGIDVGAELASGVGNGGGPSIQAEETTMTTTASTLPPPRFLPPPKFSPGGSGLLPPPKFAPGVTSSLADLVANTPAPQLPPHPVASPSGLTTSRPLVSPLQPPPDTPVVEDEEAAYAGLSARERNKLKRKRKTEAKSGVSSSSSTALPTSSAPPAKKARVVPAATTTAAVDAPRADSSTENVVGATGEAVVIDPGAKARARALGGGEVKVEEGEAGKDKLELEVKAGEWPWKGTVARLAVGLLSLVFFFFFPLCQDRMGIS